MNQNELALLRSIGFVLLAMNQPDARYDRGHLTMCLGEMEKALAALDVVSEIRDPVKPARSSPYEGDSNEPTIT